ncbi:hypothetical protein HK096_002570 [Nowakowskiella sp. JEL0078]|nr:hypothetical protein HK096_002570 [Nowakowskiella sp. JEL0078]
MNKSKKSRSHSKSRSNSSNDTTPWASENTDTDELSPLSVQNNENTGQISIRLFLNKLRKKPSVTSISDPSMEYRGRAASNPGKRLDISSSLDFREFCKNTFCSENIVLYEVFIELDNQLAYQIEKYRTGCPENSWALYTFLQNSKNLKEKTSRTFTFVSESSVSNNTEDNIECNSQIKVPILTIPQKLIPAYLRFHAIFTSYQHEVDINLPDNIRRLTTERIENGALNSDVFGLVIQHTLETMYYSPFHNYVHKRTTNFSNTTFSPPISRDPSTSPITYHSSISEQTSLTSSKEFYDTNVSPSRVVPGTYYPQMTTTTITSQTEINQPPTPLFLQDPSTAARGRKKSRDALSVKSNTSISYADKFAIPQPPFDNVHWSKDSNVVVTPQTSERWDSNGVMAPQTIEKWNSNGVVAPQTSERWNSNGVMAPQTIERWDSNGVMVPQTNDQWEELHRTASASGTSLSSSVSMTATDERYTNPGTPISELIIDDDLTIPPVGTSSEVVEEVDNDKSFFKNLYRRASRTLGLGREGIDNVVDADGNEIPVPERPPSSFSLRSKKSIVAERPPPVPVIPGKFLKG